MKKYIYKIINIKNGKIYIGQTKDYKRRFDEHTKLLSQNKHYNFHLQKSWNNYGEDSFKFEVIEYTEDYNEREKYWISYYQSTDSSRGYNIMEGGDDPPHINGSKITREMAEDIRQLLIKSGSLDYVCSMYPNITRGHINRINKGMAWKDNSLLYPLCNPLPNCFSEKVVDNIIKDLQDGILHQKEIAKKYGCARTTITAINQGVHFHRDNIEYPIRKFKLDKLTQKDVVDIMGLLQNTDLSFEQIAEMFNIKAAGVYEINLGKRHKIITNQDTYPIRQTI